MDELKKSFYFIILLFLSSSSLVTAGTQVINRNTFVGQQSSGYYGYTLATGDFNADGLADLLVGAPLEYAEGVGGSAGRVYLYYGSDRNDKKVDVLISGTEEYEYLGKSVASAGDFNGDGYEDFIVGADGFNSGKGVAFIYFGGPFMDIYPDVRLEYSSASSFGILVTKLGDVNGDGFDDVAVADAYNVFVYFGNPSKSADTYQIISGYGNKVAFAGDVNGDGYEDILVGYPQSNGQAVILLGGTTWDGTADVFMKAPYSNDQFANSLVGGTDVNGDGYSDVLIGAEDDGHNGSGAGAAYLYFGGPDMIQSNQIFGYAPSVSFYGDSAGTHLGHAVGFCPDLDGDGFGEALVGENHFWYGGKPNRTFIFKGGHHPKPAPYRILHGEEGLNGTYFGSAFASGDYDNDGYNEVFVGAYGIDKVFMFSNKLSGTENIPDLIINEDDIHLFSFSMDAGGDFNGDGYDDILAGSYYETSPLNVYFGGEAMDAVADVSSPDYVHQYVRYVGDVNADGFDDFVGLNDNDVAYLYYGNKDADLQSLRLSGADYSDVELINYGDFNGDGFSDFVLSTVNSSVDSFYVFNGGRSMSGTPDQRMGDPNEQSLLYDYTACMDINGDGYDDMILTFYYIHYEQQWIEIYLGTIDGLFEHSIISPEHFGTYSDIYEVMQIGDVNHDGFGDFMLKLSGEGYNDRAIVYGNRNAADFEFAILAGYHLNPIEFGIAGDVSGDGKEDLLLLNSSSYAFRSVAAYYGGALNLQQADIYYQYPQDVNDFTSHTVTGDFNGDGIMDIAAGNHYNEIVTFLSSPPVAAPRITGVNDVPADQGGKVTVSWFKSAYDGGRVQSYRIERSIAPAGNGFAWETIATVSARQFNYYSYTARTLSDAIEGYTGNTFFRISALDGEGRMVNQSNIAYGHSVDNLAPAAVAGLSGSANAGSVHLSWKANSETDFKEYHIYRSPDEDADVDSLSLYAAVTDTTFDDAAAPAEDFYYFVRAVDVHGNGGKCAQWLYSATGIAANSTLPDQFNLEQNYPNPFNPSTVIRYQLAKTGRVELAVYNLLGQKVKELVHQQQQPGRYSVTFDAANLASGVYLFRLSTDQGFVQTRKMMLVR